MRLRRIRVEHVRGLTAAEVVLADRGVTVLEAPNESGKTTLVEALDALLEHKDSTRRHEVRDLQPVGQDVGSLVEAELTCGEIHLTIRKRFNRDRLTELEIHAPQRRHLTGDDAHGELRRILERTTDLALYDALRFRQHGALRSPALGDSTSLAARLDEIAGGTGDAGDDALLARVRKEYERYFTPSGQDGHVLRAADDAVAAAESDVADLREKLRTIERDATRSAELDREHARLVAALAELEPALSEHRRRSERVRSLREELRTREARADVADGQLDRARRELREREELLERLGSWHTAVAGRGPAVELATEQLAAHEGRLAEADAEVEASEQHEYAARAALDTARAAADLGRRRQELAQLTGRQQRIDDALAAAEEAAAQLEAHRLTDEQLADLRVAHDALRLAEARLDDAAPTVTVTGHRPIELLLDGESEGLDTGDVLHRTVPERTVLDVPGVVEVEFRPGSSLADRHADVERARARLSDACAAAGVADLTQAEELAQRRRDHERAVADRDAVIARELAGWTRDELADRIRTRVLQLRELEARLAPSQQAEDPQLTFAVGTDVTPAQLAEVEARDVAARDAAAQARSLRASLAQELERLRGEVRVATAELRSAQHELDEHGRRLEAARTRMPDDALVVAVRQAERAAAAAQGAVADARRELGQLRADEVELLAVNAEQRVTRLRSELAAVRDELTEVRARIEVRGGEGVGEALGVATARLERARDAAARVRRRAAAAATLRQAFEDARDAAYTAYREPLRDRIVRAGRVVFGDTLDVDLDDELRVVSRRLHGTSLGWQQLSAGAQEQLSILTAVAAADLAGTGSGDGVPLVLDDALGYTDPDRLERLCAVLGRVQGPQVIVLTCVGARFQAIGGAHVVKLHDVGVTRATAVA